MRALRAELSTSPLLLIDDSTTIFEIVDPTDNHSTLGITKIRDRKLALKIKEIIWTKGDHYEQIFSKGK